jgi:hypothetical protein
MKQTQTTLRAHRQLIVERERASKDRHTVPHNDLDQRGWQDSCITMM